MASIRKRRWKSGDREREAWVVDFKDHSGNRRLETFKKKRDADARLNGILNEVEVGSYMSRRDSVPVSEACRSWLERCRDGTADDEPLERSTIREYERTVTQCIEHPEIGIGRLKLSALNPQVIQKFETQLEKSGKSKAVVRKARTTLSSVLTHAVEKQLTNRHVIRDMQQRRRKRPTRERKEIVIPTKQELRDLLAQADGPFRPILVTAIFTGMRMSELRGLKWEHVDFDKGVIRVRQRADAWGTIGPCKSKAGNRDIPMAPMVLNTLKEWKLVCPPGDLNLVFPNGKGKVELLGNLYRRGFVPLQIKAGVSVDTGEVDKDGEPIFKPKYTGFHVFRHAAASLFIEQGWTPKKVQVVMGHASIQMTFDTYGHLFPSPEDDRKAMAQVEARLIG